MSARLAPRYPPASPVNDEQLATALALLEASRALDPWSPAFLALERAAAHLQKSAKKKRRLARSQQTRATDEALRETRGLAQKRRGLEPTPAEPATLRRQRACYACKRPYVELHAYYPSLCRACGDRSLAMRAAPLDLRGRRALLTGGRIKVGLATALRMLRAGAEVHVTTRFPCDAERRYAEEPDAAEWRPRLHVHGLDFRDLRRLLEALHAFRTGPSFDILINNAAQTVWHPPAYYEALYAGEQPPSATHESALLPLVVGSLSRLDRARDDGWVKSLGEVTPVDAVEVHVVNAVAPFLVCNLLVENLARSSFADRYVVNVTAVEGQFARDDKPARHPHTNMAKAALNMLTRTSALDLAARGIHMVSVDPGWMSSEGKHVGPDVRPALEAEDCAARVLHPVAVGLAGAPLHGVLLKDFVEVPW